MKLSINTLEKLIQRHKKHFNIDDYASDYGEPGYTLPEGKQGILLANWHDVPEHISNWIEHHYVTKWSDEWVIDSSESLAYRSSPDCYGWSPSYFLTNDCEIFSIHYAKDHIEEYTDYLIDNSDMCDNFGINWLEHGFSKYNIGEYETGFYPGQNDRPEKILTEIKAKFPNAEVLFKKQSVGQFDVSWNAYYRLPTED